MSNMVFFEYFVVYRKKSSLGLVNFCTVILPLYPKIWGSLKTSPCISIMKCSIELGVQKTPSSKFWPPMRIKRVRHLVQKNPLVSDSFSTPGGIVHVVMDPKLTTFKRRTFLYSWALSQLSPSNSRQKSRKREILAPWEGGTTLSCG